jgi:hypothetical protein
LLRRHLTVLRLARAAGAQDPLPAAQRVAGAQGAGGSSGSGRYELVNTAVTATSTPEARRLLRRWWRLRVACAPPGVRWL